MINALNGAIPMDKEIDPLKKNSKSPMKKEAKAKRAKAQRPVQQETKEVLAELVEQLRGKLELKLTSASPAEAGPRGELSPNLERLTVGVDLGDQWSHYCILGLQGEMLSEGQLQTREAEVAEFFQALAPARVVMEVGTHSPWVQEIIAGEGHEVLVANPRLMEGSKRRKRKNDRIDAKKLARGDLHHHGETGLDHLRADGCLRHSGFAGAPVRCPALITSLRLER